MGGFCVPGKIGQYTKTCDQVMGSFELNLEALSQTGNREIPPPPKMEKCPQNRPRTQNH